MTSGEPLRINGTVFYAYQVCPREAWFYVHRVNPPADHPLLDLGRLVHESTYTKERKEIFVDQLIKVDIWKDTLIAEVKRSSRHRKAARMQLLFYLFYLKQRYGLALKGVLLFPRERQKEEVMLTEEEERRIASLLQEMEHTLHTDKPPPARWLSYCRSCSFLEICWA